MENEFILLAKANMGCEKSLHFIRQKYLETIKRRTISYFKILSKINNISIVDAGDIDILVTSNFNKWVRQIKIKNTKYSLLAILNNISKQTMLREMRKWGCWKDSSHVRHNFQEIEYKLICNKYNVCKDFKLRGYINSLKITNFEKEILILKIVDGRSINEIAIELRENPRKIRNWYYKAVLKLRKK